MDANGRHLNNNDLRIVRPLEQGAPDSREESDAIHHRLRVRENNETSITCLSCNEIFHNISVKLFFEHYREHLHKASFGNCLYCQGKVHRYCVERTDGHQVSIYHDCLRWKRGEDR